MTADDADRLDTPRKSEGGGVAKGLACEPRSSAKGETEEGIRLRVWLDFERCHAREENRMRKRVIADERSSWTIRGFVFRWVGSVASGVSLTGVRFLFTASFAAASAFEWWSGVGMVSPVCGQHTHGIPGTHPGSAEYNV